MQREGEVLFTGSYWSEAGIVCGKEQVGDATVVVRGEGMGGQVDWGYPQVLLGYGKNLG